MIIGPVKRIQHIVCGVFGLTVEQMVGDTKRRSHVRPRQLAMYLAYNFTRSSMPEIARRFNRDHTTLLWSLRAIPKAFEAEEHFAELAEQAIWAVACSLPANIRKNYEKIITAPEASLPTPERGESFAPTPQEAYECQTYLH